MFKITKATNKSPNIFETLKDLGLTFQDKNSLDYLNQVSQQGLFDLEPLQAPKIQRFYTEADAKFEGCEVAWDGEIDVRESIEGTGLSETFVINQRRGFRGHVRANYITRIDAAGGNDVIIGNHSGLTPRNAVIVHGGEGIDQFASTQRTGSMFQIMDMEAGETFTTHADYDELELFRELPHNGQRLYHISSSESPYRHVMYIDADSTIFQALDSDGNNVYICVPEA